MTMNLVLIIFCTNLALGQSHLYNRYLTYSPILNWESLQEPSKLHIELAKGVYFYLLRFGQYLEPMHTSILHTYQYLAFYLFMG